MSLVEDAQNHVAAAKQALEPVTAGVAAAHESTTQLATGSREAGYDQKAAQAGAIRDALGDLHAVLTDSASTLEDIRAKLEDLKGLLTGTSTPDRASPAPTPSASAFRPMRTDQAKADRVRPYVGEPIAYATLYDEQGRELVGVHNASDDGPAKGADWAEPWGSYPRLRRHVEAHAAARMSQDGHRQLAMYINMKPCSYPDGCKQNLRALVPKGSILFVHQVFADGSSKVHPFPGTGAALRSSNDHEG